MSTKRGDSKMLGAQHGIGGAYAAFDDFPPNPAGVNRVKSEPVEKAKFGDQESGTAGEECAPAEPVEEPKFDERGHSIVTDQELRALKADPSNNVQIGSGGLTGHLKS